MAERWKCLVCFFLCVFLTELLLHLNSVHYDDMSFKQKCGLPGCSSRTEYIAANSFVKHVRMHHCALLFSTYEDVFGGKETSLSGEREQSDEIGENKSGNYFREGIKININNLLVTLCPQAPWSADGRQLRLRQSSQRSNAKNKVTFSFSEP